CAATIVPRDCNLVPPPARGCPQPQHRGRFVPLLRERGGVRASVPLPLLILLSILTLFLAAPLQATAGPANDNFANATVTGGSSATLTGSNVGATKETGEPNHAGIAGGKSVWWSWTAPSAGSVTINTFGSSFDTLLGVYTGTSVSSLTTIPAIEPTAGCQGGSLSVPSPARTSKARRAA